MNREKYGYPSFDPYQPPEGNRFNIFIPLGIAIILLILIIGIAHADTASWYSANSCRREGTSGTWTASGEKYNENDLTAAMWYVPFGTLVKVTNLANNKMVIVRVTDRGPNKKLFRQGRIIDLSKQAFSKIASLKSGVIKIKLEIIKKR